MDPRSLLKASGLFSGLDDTVIDAVEKELEHRHLKSGDLLFFQGDPGSSLYLVIHGRLRVFVDDGSGNGLSAVREIGVGESVGEMALISGERRSATVCAIRDSDLLRLSKRAFELLVRSHPDAMMHLVRLLVAWIRDGQAPGGRREFAVMALVPLGEGVPIEEVAARLSDTLAERGRSRYVTARQADDQLGPGVAHSPEQTPGHGRIAAWLSRLESDHRFLLLVTDSGDSEWTRRCVRDADRVLYVAEGSAEPLLHPIERRIEQEQGRLNRPRRDLLLLHPPTDGPAGAQAGTRHWLERYRVFNHFHVRRDRPADYRRLVRLLTDNATLLVLGGGGARGFAHIGVLRALEEAGLEIDAVGGTSMGAIVGSQFAMGWDAATLLADNRRAFLSARSLHDFTLPVISLLRGRDGYRVLASLFRDIRIEDLKYNFFCTSTNLTRADTVVHRHGSLLAAIRASISVPGILPPVFSGGDVLVDGGVVNNLPVDVMAGLHRGRVIAVDVSPTEDLATRPDYLECPSPWRVVWRRIKPSGSPPRVPSIFDILMRSATIGSTRATAMVKREVSLYLHPPIEQFGMTDWKAFDRLVDIGYRASQQPVADWLERQGRKDRSA